MTSFTPFKSGRTKGGSAYTADRSGSQHTRIVRLSSYALAPLGVLTMWFIAGAMGKPHGAVLAELGRPFPALVMIAFAIVALYHARLGADTIIEDYVHDPALAETAFLVNKWLTFGVSALWVLSILLISGSK
jgi:succinate dehydrogenase / fumarate reductase membrane anchor subunit